MGKTIDFLLYNDGNGRLLEEENISEYEAERVKHRVTLLLTEREAQEISELKGCQKTLFLRDLAVKIINEK